MIFDTRDWTPSTWANAGSHGQPELGWASGLSLLLPDYVD
jgi:hypothetical protein